MYSLRCRTSSRLIRTEALSVELLEGENGYEGYRDFESESNGAIAPELSANLERIVHVRAESLSIPNLGGPMTLSEMDAALHDHVDSVVDQALRLSDHSLLKERLEALKDFSSRICCPSCRNGVSPPNGPAEICRLCNRVLVSESYCIHYFSEQFGLARGITSDYYRKVGIDVDPLRISFATDWVDSRYRIEGIRPDIHAFPKVSLTNASVTYVDICLTGCLQIEGAFPDDARDFARMFIESTQAWSKLLGKRSREPPQAFCIRACSFCDRWLARKASTRILLENPACAWTLVLTRRSSGSMSISPSYQAPHLFAEATNSFQFA